MRAARSLAPISRSKSPDRELRLGAASPADAAVSSGSRLIRGLQRRSLLRRSTLGSIQRFGEVIRHARQAGVFGILDHRRQGSGDGLGCDCGIARRLLVGLAPRPRNRTLVDMGAAHQDPGSWLGRSTSPRLVHRRSLHPSCCSSPRLGLPARADVSRPAYAADRPAG